MRAIVCWLPERIRIPNTENLPLLGSSEVELRQRFPVRLSFIG